MRNAAIIPLLAVLACAERLPETGADARAAGRVAAETAAAEDPRILVACPEATNYAPPDWPLEPGDNCTGPPAAGTARSGSARTSSGARPVTGPCDPVCPGVTCWTEKRCIRLR